MAKTDSKSPDTSGAPDQSTNVFPDLKVEVSKAVVKATISTELTKQFTNYQNILNIAGTVIFTKDNLQKEGTILTTLRNIIKSIDTLREAKKKPYFQAGKTIDEAAKELTAPIQQVLDSLNASYKTIAQQIENDRRQIEMENQRIESVRQAITSFVIDTSQAIAAATTPDEIVAIEKNIGSHKANKSKYQEFLPELIEKADELVPIIKQQKEHIKTLGKIQKEKDKAEESGDDAKLMKLMEQEETVTAQLQEGAVNIQETAVAQSIGSGTTIATTVAPGQVKARRTTWKAELIDVKEAMKKCPELLDVSLNSEKVSANMKVLKDAKVFDGKTEVIINGIKYYEEKLY